MGTCYLLECASHYLPIFTCCTKKLDIYQQGNKYRSKLLPSTLMFLDRKVSLSACSNYNPSPPHTQAGTRTHARMHTHAHLTTINDRKQRDLITHNCNCICVMKYLYLLLFTNTLRLHDTVEYVKAQVKGDLHFT